MARQASQASIELILRSGFHSRRVVAIMYRVRPSPQNTIDDYREPIPAVRFLESPLCHRYTSCPILRPCSKLDMELHMTAMAALGGRIGQRSALLLWCSWLANFSCGCQSGNKIAGTSRTPGHPPARRRSPAKAFHAEQLDCLGNQIINRITFDHYERRQRKVRFTSRLPAECRSELGR